MGLTNHSSVTNLERLGVARFASERKYLLAGQKH